MFTLTFVDLEHENGISIWEFEKMNFLKKYFSFFSSRYTIKFTEQNETILLMNSDTLIWIWILAFPIGIIQVSTPRKWSFLIYFSCLHDYWTPTTLNTLVHNSLGEMEWCEKRAFNFSKCEKWKTAET